MKTNTLKKIIIAIPCLLRGGTEQQTLLLVKALVESGYDVEVCCFFEYDEQMVTEFKAEGADVLILGWSRNISVIKFICALSELFRKKSPNVVHVQYMAPGLLPIVATRLAGVPIVLAAVHYPGRPHGIAAHVLLRLGAWLTNCFTCVSEATEKSWFGDSCVFDPNHPEKVAGRRHITIPNAVDIERIDKALVTGFPKVAEIKVQLEGKMVLGTVARLSREKGIDILLEAFAKLQQTIPPTHLLIVGDGNHLEDLKSFALQLGIGDVITWTGRLRWEEAMGCLGLMDVVAVPSRFEGFGLTAVEAMVCGRPVVASRVDGLAEVIQDDVNGYLVPAENVSAFAEALINLLKDEELRNKIGSAARKHVEEKYAYPLFRERVKALYEAFNLKD